MLLEFLFNYTKYQKVKTVHLSLKIIDVPCHQNITKVLGSAKKKGKKKILSLKISHLRL